MGLMFGNRYNGRRVLVTGHTGFKGSWLVSWLQRLGGEVCGYSSGIPTEPSHWNLLHPDVQSVIGDIRDLDQLTAVVNEFQPEIVFHLAAQALVRPSYADPVETFGSNVMGTVHVLEACRHAKSVQAVVNVTSDKCYENRERHQGYCETDPMGGHDPYSASKGCAELVASSYRRSFFNDENSSILMASCRAGNVIGGGDWAVDRLIPDAYRAVATQQPLSIRNPQATRPWQHVLEPLSGYLLVGQKLLAGERAVADGWNFGPAESGVVSVADVIALAEKYWPVLRVEMGANGAELHEAGLLQLDCSKALSQLKWRGIWDVEISMARTINWYQAFHERSELMTDDDLDAYVADARAAGMGWAE